MIIAVDGPAASGKGTLARRLAEQFGLHYLDTGLLYRAVALMCLERGFRADDAWAAVAMTRNLSPNALENIEALRAPGVGEAASLVARIPMVRASLLGYQRNFAHQSPGAVLDGRDIGTVVCPEADVKLFIQATPQVRANRRFLELKGRGEDVTEAGVLELIRRRDARDAGREVAPMLIASNAHLLDTSNLDIDSAFAAALGVIERTIGQTAS